MRPASRALVLGLTLALVVVGCEKIAPPPASRCVAQQGDRRASASEVCARFTALSCRLPDCVAAYDGYRSRVPPAEFDRLTACYLRASSCDEVDQCERACGPDGGTVTVHADAAYEAGAIDAATDTPAGDAGDTGARDAGVADTAPRDTGATDSGTTDSGTADTGPADSGTSDAGPSDAGVSATDAATSDAEAIDGGG